MDGKYFLKSERERNMLHFWRVGGVIVPPASASF